MSEDGVFVPSFSFMDPNMCLILYSDDQVGVGVEVSQEPKDHLLSFLEEVGVCWGRWGRKSEGRAALPSEMENRKGNTA